MQIMQKKSKHFGNCDKYLQSTQLHDYQDGEDRGSDRLQCKVAILCWHHIPPCHQPFERTWVIVMNSNCRSCICEPLFLFDATAGMIQSVWPCHEAIGMQQNTHNDVQFKLQAMYLWRIIFCALAGDMMHCRVYGHVTKQNICNKKKQVLHQCIKSNALLVILIISDNDNY